MSPFTNTLGIKVEKAGQGHATLFCAWRPELANDAGMAHGGVVASIMDTACGVALVSNDEGKRVGNVVTVSFSLSYMAPFKEGDSVRCEARLVGGGKKIKTVEVVLKNATTEELIASGFGTFRRISRD